MICKCRDKITSEHEQNLNLFFFLYFSEINYLAMTVLRKLKVKYCGQTGEAVHLFQK